MNKAFSLEKWFDFVDNTDCFDVRVSGRVSKERVVIICSNGVDVFNKELFEIALDLMAHEEEWYEVYQSEVSSF